MGGTIEVKDGTPGTSVTITSINPSDNDETPSVILFSDNNTLNVYNGKDGDQGASVSSVVCVTGNGSETTTTPSHGNGATNYYRIKDKNNDWLTGTIEVKDGKDGSSVTITSIDQSEDDKNPSVILFSDGKSLSIKNGKDGESGAPGDPGAPGEDGNGITSITKTSTSGLVDTYTIKYTKKEDDTFTVTNGAPGNPGDPGAPGEDGNGITSITKTSTSGLVDTYTIKYTKKEDDTFTVTNGAPGNPGDPGAPGEDGYSIFYSSVQYKDDEKPTTISKTTITNNGREIQVGDLILSSKSDVFRVTSINNDTSNVSYNVSYTTSIKGEKGQDGTSVKILGSVDKVEDLNNIQNPAIGDGYIVGEILYVYSNTGWIPAGKIKGPQGDSVKSIVCVEGDGSETVTGVKYGDGVTNYYRIKDDKGKFLGGTIEVTNGNGGIEDIPIVEDESGNLIIRDDKDGHIGFIIDKTGVVKTHVLEVEYISNTQDDDLKISTLDTILSIKSGDEMYLDSKAGLYISGDVSFDGGENGESVYMNTDLTVSGTITGNLKGNAETSTTATNLAIPPSFATTSNNNITITAGGKTSAEFTVPYATTANTAINLATTPSLAASGNNITITAGEKTSSEFTVPYATSAGSATNATNDSYGREIASTYAISSDFNEFTSYVEETFSKTDDKTSSSNKTGTKLFLVGAEEQDSSGQTTYSNSNCYVGTDNCLYSNGSKTLTDIPDDLVVRSISNTQGDDLTISTEDMALILSSGDEIHLSSTGGLFIDGGISLDSGSMYINDDLTVAGTINGTATNADKIRYNYLNSDDYGKTLYICAVDKSEPIYGDAYDIGIKYLVGDGGDDILTIGSDLYVFNNITADGDITADGGGFIGDLTGNADTATTLKDSRTLTIGSTGKTFNGSDNVSWTLAEIGAMAAGDTSHATHVTTGSQTWSGDKTFNDHIILGGQSSSSVNSTGQILFGTSGAKMTSNGNGNVIINPNSGTDGQIVLYTGNNPKITIGGSSVVTTTSGNAVSATTANNVYISTTDADDGLPILFTTWRTTASDATTEGVAGNRAMYMDDARSFYFNARANTVHSSGGFYETSDERLKDIVNPITVDLDKLSKLRKVYFNWKDKPDSNLQLGMIAQDVQELYPELVSETNGELSLSYDRLSVIALEAIDLLHNENNELKSRIEKLESLVNQLAEKVND